MNWHDIAVTIILLLALCGAVWAVAQRDGLDWRRNMFGQTRPRRRR